jgi:hypothetical protein
VSVGVTVLLGSLFAVVALVLCCAAVLALFGVTQVAMSGAEAIERDGMAPGMRAPSWSLPDFVGNDVSSPPRAPLQLIMFTDHSLKSFPSVVDGLRLVTAGEGLEAVVLSRACVLAPAPGEPIPVTPAPHHGENLETAAPASGAD